MKVAIIGSRSFNDYEKLKHEITEFIHPADIELIVSGGARGADTLGIDFAKAMSIKYKIHNAEWTNFEEPCIIKVNKSGQQYNAL